MIYAVTGKTEAGSTTVLEASAASDEEAVLTATDAWKTLGIELSGPPVVRPMTWGQQDFYVEPWGVSPYTDECEIGSHCNCPAPVECQCLGHKDEP